MAIGQLVPPAADRETNYGAMPNPPWEGQGALHHMPLQVLKSMHECSTELSDVSVPTPPGGDRHVAARFQWFVNGPVVEQGQSQAPREYQQRRLRGGDRSGSAFAEVDGVAWYMSLLGRATQPHSYGRAQTESPQSHRGQCRGALCQGLN